jgi:translation initiation factor IF-2
MQKSTTNSTERPPIVVVMGHVDHGKSTLLDFIRHTSVVAGEAGGITQHVAAYEVEHCSPETKECKRITFIDTPGHAAFQSIRARGANVADIAILVVAADDGVKAQTLEALASIREAKIPFIVAINKIDKPNADISRTQASLLEKEVYLEKLGGDVPWVAISAKAGTGVGELLDLILIVSELQEFRGDASVPAEGYVIEAHRDAKRGIAATLIITNGILKSGSSILAGHAIAPVRIMEDHTGKAIREATFSTPITLVGFDELPAVGESFTTYANKKTAEAAREAGASHSQARAFISNAKATVAGEHFALPVIVRADTTGSLEAILHETAKIGDEYTSISIIQSGIGNVSENDVKSVMASHAGGAVLIGFNVGIDPIAEALARTHNIPVETFTIIYKLTERLQEILKSSAPKRIVEEIQGHAQVLKCFSSHRGEQVIGGKVSDGTLSKGAAVRVVRRRVVIGVGKVINIQTNKKNVDKVDAGTEFGAQVNAEFEIAQGDILESFTSVEQ